jgi:hypothetical protein
MDGGTVRPAPSEAGAKTEQVQHVLLRHTARVPRYVAALGVVGWGLWALVVGDARVCRQEVPEGATAAIEVCDHPSATDGAVLATLAVVVLLLGPDLSEAGVAGVTVKRKVEEAKADAAAARAEVASLRLAVSQESFATSTAQANVDVHDGGAAMLEVLARHGLLSTPHGAAPSPATGPAPLVSAETDTFLLTACADAVLRLVPEPFSQGTVIGVAGDLTLVMGAEIPDETYQLIRTDPEGAVAAALQGQPAATPASGDVPIVVAVPVSGEDQRVVGALAVVLPAGMTLTEFDPADLAEAAEGVSAFAEYFLASRG